MSHNKHALDSQSKKVIKHLVYSRYDGRATWETLMQDLYLLYITLNPEISSREDAFNIGVEIGRYVEIVVNSVNSH